MSGPLIKREELWDLRTSCVDAHNCYEKCLKLTGAKRMHEANKKALYRISVFMKEISDELKAIWKSEEERK